jgi:hypothetical protein
LHASISIDDQVGVFLVFCKKHTARKWLEFLADGGCTLAGKDELRTDVVIACDVLSLIPKKRAGAPGWTRKEIPSTSGFCGS